MSSTNMSPPPPPPPTSLSLLIINHTTSNRSGNELVDEFGLPYFLNPDEYDTDDGYYDAEWFYKFVPAIFIYTMTFIFGFFGNLLVIFAILYLKKLQSVTNLFLVSLASADLLLIVFCVPIKITEFFTHYWVFGPFMCKIFHYFQNFTAICSVINLTVMSLERYFAILYPLKARYTCTKKRAQIMIVAIWVVSFFGALPIVFGKAAVEIGTFRKVHACLRVWKPLHWILFEIYRLLIILVVPFFIMLVAYSVICYKLWNMPTKRRRLTETISLHQGVNSAAPLKMSKSESMELSKTSDSTKFKSNSIQMFKCQNNRPDDETTRKQIIKMLICIIVIFFICWAPITINNLLVSFGLLPNLNVGIHWYLRLSFYIMSFINSAVNPIVYAFMSKNFREAFKQIFSIYTFRNKRRRFRTDSGSGRGAGGHGGLNPNEFVRAGSEPRSSLLNSTKKTSTSSLNHPKNNCSLRDLRNV